MSNIRTIVGDTLRSHGLASYISQAEPVIAALTEREEQAIEVIREQGVRLGASEQQIENVLIEAGLVERTPEPVNEAAPTGSLEEQVVALAQQVRDLATTVNSALDGARRQGVRI